MTTEPWDGKTERRAGIQTPQAQQAPMVRALEALTEELIGTRDAMSALPTKEALDHDKEQIRKGFIFMGLIAIAFLIAGGVGAISLHRVTDVSQGNREILHLIEDCSRPGGKCFEEQLTNPALARLVDGMTSEITERVGCILQVEPGTGRSDAVIEACAKGADQ